MSEHLFESFGRVEWLMHRYHQYNHRRRGPMGDPHRGQGRILAMLKLQPEISQKDLSYLLDIRPQSLGELLVKLERGGYITRTPSETDRRMMNISLTDKGRQEAQQQTQTDDLFAFLSEEEQKTLGGFLSRVIDALEQQLGDQTEPEWGSPAPPPFHKDSFHRCGADRRPPREAYRRPDSIREPDSYPKPEDFIPYGWDFDFYADGDQHSEPPHKKKEEK